MSAETQPPTSRAICPICRRRPADPVLRPFCSKRCADVDLQRWLGGVYAIPCEEDGGDVAGSPGGEG